MRVSRIATAFAATLLFAACAGPDWRVVQLYGGAGSVEAIEAPTRVEAFRIAPDVVGPDPTYERVGLHRVTAGPVLVDESTSSELSAILLDPDSYDWQRAKGCEFRPGVGVRYTREVSRVDLALCFECDELTIHRQGRRVGVEDFDAVRPGLVSIVKRVFPNDPEIQALKP
jgi:hypothetical protein